MNGGSRRRKNRWVMKKIWLADELCNTSRKGRNRRSSPVEEFLKAIETRNEDKSEGSLVRLELEVTPEQTRHRRKLVRVQPNRIDLSKELDYQVHKGPKMILGFRGARSNCRSPDFKSPVGPTKNLERHYNRVVVCLFGWLVGCNAGYNRLIPF